MKKIYHELRRMIVATNGPAIAIMPDKVNKRIFQDKVNINSSDGTKQNDK